RRSGEDPVEAALALGEGAVEGREHDQRVIQGEAEGSGEADGADPVRLQERDADAPALAQALDSERSGEEEQSGRQELEVPVGGEQPVLELGPPARLGIEDQRAPQLPRAEEEQRDEAEAV